MSIDVKEDMFQSVAILKYYDPTADKYDFIVYDKHNFADETERFDKMIEKQAELESKGMQVLWVKTLPLMEI